MKTKLFLLALLVAGALRAADDPFAAIRTALDHNQLDAADTALAPLVAAANPDPQAWFYLSQVRSRQHRTKEAVALADQAVAAQPNRADYQSNLGVILSQRTGEVSFMQQALLAGRMLGAFKKSVALDPNHLPGYIGLARYYTNAPAIAGGSRETAEKYAHEVEQRVPQLGTLELAYIAEHFDDAPRAFGLFAKAAATDPNNGWICECLGRVSEKLQHPDQARTYYEKALALDPSLADAKTALARLTAPAAPHS